MNATSPPLRPRPATSADAVSVPVAAPAQAPGSTQPLALPRPDDFALSGTFLNAAFSHPVPKIVAQQMRRHVETRTAGVANTQAAREQAIRHFARLVGADTDELAWVPSTTVGENLVVQALGVAQGGRVITDALHFEGSLYLYQALASRGVQLQVLPQQDGQVSLEQYEAALAVPHAGGPTLVAISLVSAHNGFQHDLQRLCALAHAQGARVYADIIQAAGNTPIDLSLSGVDFAACATYKWLMGDFGAGFLYVRRAVQPQLRPPQYGYRQLQAFQTHLFPYDPPAQELFSYEKRGGAAALFEVGTVANAAVVALSVSLGYLLDIGVERIEAHRQPMLQLLRAELPRHGYLPLTPADSRSAIVAFARQDAAATLGPRLAAAGVQVQLHAHRLRISPSFYNELADIERLLDLLAS
ncbi:Selenocysteine lyase/Cysteine desulfurase [Roseateles sp. YR242]|uniref:aminotransferase class V-fold PLP-dependent enzyme n=1 Tax=Roseateles sp. YR242 TaxID=1855305 RepID=UPI0008AE31BE|nr:aminotransferase class V-fold PLP-dependent enzyme [Roseateles sp. YR242]SEK87675.1 Selenocysteine lyase/Cysteine desulfurase [Roseateles sp. YR242]